MKVRNLYIICKWLTDLIIELLPILTEDIESIVSSLFSFSKNLSENKPSAFALGTIIRKNNTAVKYDITMQLSK